MEIDKKELKEILTSQRKEYERHIGAVVESFTEKSIHHARKLGRERV